MAPTQSIRVSSLYMAPRLARSWAHQVISLLDPDIRGQIPTATMFGIHEREHHIEYFYDRESGVGIPSYAAIVRILSFARYDSCILVHCHAGMSRSPSIAIGLLIARGMTAREATRFVFSQNLIDKEGSYMEPNEVILRHLNTRLGLTDDLVNIVREEMRR